MAKLRKIAPCLWFDTQAEEAARFYAGIFRGSKILRISHYGKEGHEIHGRPAGSVLAVSFELEGQKFTAMNGGPQFKFSEAISLQVNCETQKEIDELWEKLCEGGDPKAQACGWLKDRYGLSWQIVPAFMDELFGEPTSPKTERLMRALLEMKKLDIAALRRAYEG